MTNNETLGLLTQSVVWTSGPDLRNLSAVTSGSEMKLR